MFLVQKSRDIDFAHHIRGHEGACINVHGHTWRFEIGVAAHTLDQQGFVVDFSLLKREVLNPCHQLLDHALAIGETTFGEISGDLERMGRSLLSSRLELHGRTDTLKIPAIELNQAKTMFPGGMKVAVFPFSPTSERLAKWLFELTSSKVANERVSVVFARVYETQRPTESIAEYRQSL